MINVLLATYKGQTYLPALIDSILQQQDVDVQIQISDDESAVTLFQFLQSKFNDILCLGQVTVRDGPHQGVNANFSSLIHHTYVREDELYAFSDQDDIWLPNKLKRAEDQLLNVLKEYNEQAILYAGRTMVCDKSLAPLYLSKGMPRTASFKNALLESIGGGNTMTFNASALTLLQKSTYPVHHDWLTYMVVTACGGKVLFDETPYVLYRQHDGNIIGANKGLKAKLFRLKKILGNEFKGWADDNIKALTPLSGCMTTENQIIFNGFKRLHNMQGWYHCVHRIILFKQLGLYRQRRIEHWGFMLAAFLGKI